MLGLLTEEGFNLTCRAVCSPQHGSLPRSSEGSATGTLLQCDRRPELLPPMARATPSSSAFEATPFFWGAGVSQASPGPVRGETLSLSLRCQVPKPKGTEGRGRKGESRKGALSTDALPLPPSPWALLSPSLMHGVEKATGGHQPTPTWRELAEGPLGLRASFSARRLRLGLTRHPS